MNMVPWQRTCATQAMELAEERVCCSVVEMAQTQLAPGALPCPLVNVSCIVAQVVLCGLTYTLGW